jgi:hypothetical protein
MAAAIAFADLSDTHAAVAKLHGEEAARGGHGSAWAITAQARRCTIHGSGMRRMCVFAVGRYFQSRRSFSLRQIERRTS